MSIEVPIPQLFDEVASWGFGYLVTVGGDERPHLLALHPQVVTGDGRRVLRFDAGGGRACRNVASSARATIVFPPAPHADGMSLIVDGDAEVDGDHVDVHPTWAVLHRAAPLP